MILLRPLLVWTAAAVCLAPMLLHSAEQATSKSTTPDGKPGPIVKAAAGAVEGRMEGNLRVLRASLLRCLRWVQRAGDRLVRCLDGKA